MFGFMAGGGVLATAIVLQIASRGQASPGFEPVALEAVVPKVLSGWNVRDEPLGDTEGLTAETLKVLKLDRFVYRTFTQGGVSFSIYIAYWRQSTTASPLVIGHLPDRCWTSSGMHCLSMKNKDVKIAADRTLPPAESRIFVTPTNTLVYVLYWLWLGGKQYDFGLGLHGVYDARHGFHRANIGVQMRHVIDNLLQGSREHYFVRISANVPMENLLRDRAVARLFQTVASIGRREN